MIRAARSERPSRSRATVAASAEHTQTPVAMSSIEASKSSMRWEASASWMPCFRDSRMSSSTCARMPSRHPVRWNSSMHSLLGSPADSACSWRWRRCQAFGRRGSPASSSWSVHQWPQIACRASMYISADALRSATVAPELVTSARSSATTRASPVEKRVGLATIGHWPTADWIPRAKRSGSVSPVGATTLPYMVSMCGAREAPTRDARRGTAMRWAMAAVAWSPASASASAHSHQVVAWSVRMPRSARAASTWGDTAAAQRWACWPSAACRYASFTDSWMRPAIPSGWRPSSGSTRSPTKLTSHDISAGGGCRQPGGVSHGLIAASAVLARRA